MNVNPLRFLFPLPGIFILASAVSGQNPAIPAYEGSQPELVAGVENCLATGKPKLRHNYLAGPDTVASHTSKIKQYLTSQ